MAVMLELPPKLGAPDTEPELSMLREYLLRLVRQMEEELNKIEEANLK